jgi:epoxyqueuosine reductase
LLVDDSPLVRVAAVWALKRLVPDAHAAALGAKYVTDERDEDVRTEWAS